MKHIEGHKHLLECRCVLPQFQDRDDLVFHRFSAFSTCETFPTLDRQMENEPPFTFHESIVACPNCSLLHKVTGFCRSTIMQEDDAGISVNIDDLRVGMPADLVSVLESYDCDLPVWQEAKFAWAADAARNVALSKTDSGRHVLMKLLVMNPGGRYSIETRKYQKTI